jgi:hypothetical protein
MDNQPFDKGVFGIVFGEMLGLMTWLEMVKTGQL